MRVIDCQIENFGSYKNLQFSFDNKGLCLIHGATGSGKSTMCDIISWVLFGETGKGGGVNDVIAWDATECTHGRVTLEINGIDFVITRERNPNDLYFWYGSARTLVPLRGKDLVDTQRIINAKLGINADLYLSGAYFHEFSRTAAFFTATAKGRREICEQIVDLSLAETLKTNLNIKVKTVEKELAEAQRELSTKRASEDVLMRMRAQAKKQYAVWEKEQKDRIDTVVDKALNFESDNKLKIEAAQADRNAWLEVYTNKSDKCPMCGGPFHKEVVRTPGTPYDRQIQQLETATNTYEDQLKVLVDQVNPHRDTEANTSAELSTVRQRIEVLSKTADQKQAETLDINMLTDTVGDFRGALVKRTIQELQTTTNDYITKYFDAEIRVLFSVESADKVETLIYKDGNECVYTQLSKGQRQLLKLSFGLAVMRAVTNHHGVKFNAVFLDEALDGLDDRFKVKAFALLETLALEYESVFCVEHSSELKTMFTNQIKVELISGNSVLSE